MMRLGTRIALCLTLIPGMAAAQAQHDYVGQGDWRQFGGPGRDFQVKSPGLAESWPEDGPTRVWSRPLGPGHSSIIVDDGRLFTMYRPGAEGESWRNQETVIALDAATGHTAWEYSYASEPLNFRFGAGPHASPLVVGDRLFTTGTNKQLHVFKKADRRGVVVARPGG